MAAELKFTTDPAYIRKKLDDGQESLFVVNIDENLRVYVRPRLGYETIVDTDQKVYYVYVECFAEYVTKTSDGEMITDEATILELTDFIESDTEAA